MLAQLSPDANTGGDSSTQPDAKGQGSSPEQQAGEEVVESAEQTSTETTESEAATESTEESTEAKAVATESAETQSEEQTTEKQEAPVVFDKPEDNKLEFHKHPRFQELVAEKNTFKQEFEKIKPAAEANRALQSFMQSNGIQPTELTAALEYLRLVKVDPAKAYELIKPDVEKLSTYVGERLPQDIEAAVASGTLSPEHAKEIARARAEQQFQQYRGQSQQQMQMQQQEQVIQGSINAWAEATMKNDPDFRPRNQSNPNAVDGKWEFVDMKLRTMRQANPPKTAQEAVAQVETAYKEANNFFRSFAPKAAVKKAPLKSSASSQNSSAVVKTADDVVKAILSGKKPHELKYS